MYLRVNQIKLAKLSIHALCEELERSENDIQAHMYAHVQHNCHTKTQLDALTSLYTSLCCRQDWLVMGMYAFSCLGL